MSEKTDLNSTSILESLLSFPGETDKVLDQLDARGWDVSKFRKWPHTAKFLADCQDVLNTLLK